MTDTEEPRAPLVDVGRYPKLSEARARGLVVAAMDLPHWIVREGDEFLLRVEVPAREAVAAELENYEREHEEAARAKRDDTPLPRIERAPLVIAGWAFLAAWLAQSAMSEATVEQGIAVSGAIVRGEWWRALTALTLHADLSHVAANAFFGLIYGAFIAMRFGAGAGWLLVVLAGFAGNEVNAFFYQSENHRSLGASTAVFGSLGLLVAGEIAARISSRSTLRWWQIVGPLGGGFALLAWLGSGGEQPERTDYMAHLWGFLAGLVLGGAAGFFPLREKLPAWMQRAAGALALTLPLAAWWLAVR